MPPPRRPEPEPLKTNDVAAITVGTLAWLVALALTLVFRDRLADHGNEDWVWIAASGAGLGVIGILWMRWRRDAARRRAHRGCHRSCRGRADQPALPRLVPGG